MFLYKYWFEIFLQSLNLIYSNFGEMLDLKIMSFFPCSEPEMPKSDNDLPELFCYI